LGIVHRSFC